MTADGHYVVKTPPLDPYPVDVLMFQGFRDSLFNFNEAYHNYQCLKQAGGDVRLLSYPFGHHYLEPSIGLVEEGANDVPTFVGALSGISSGDSAVAGSCGDIDVKAATLAWFNEKLKGIGNADDVITSGHKVCMSLTYNDAVTRDTVPIGGVQRPVQTPLGTPVPALTGLAGAVPTLVPLGTLQQDAVLAGIPTLDVSMDLPFGEYCQQTTDPVTGTGTCDAILFAGLGVLRSNGVAEVIDEQVLPLRGLGVHQTNMVGIAERLHQGDKLFLLLYGAHPTFITGLSKDLTALSVLVGGSVSLPLLDSDGQLPRTDASLASAGAPDASLPDAFSVAAELDMSVSTTP